MQDLKCILNVKLGSLYFILYYRQEDLLKNSSNLYFVFLPV